MNKYQNLKLGISTNIIPGIRQSQQNKDPHCSSRGKQFAYVILLALVITLSSKLIISSI